MPAALVVTTLASPDGPYHVAVSERGVVAAETGGDLAAIDFERDYYPAMSEHYREQRDAATE